MISKVEACLFELLWLHAENEHERIAQKDRFRMHMYYCVYTCYKAWYHKTTLTCDSYLVT
jgi:hypothetical protein